MNIITRRNKNNISKKKISERRRTSFRSATTHVERDFLLLHENLSRKELFKSDPRKEETKSFFSTGFVD